MVVISSKNDIYFITEVVVQLSTHTIAQMLFAQTVKNLPAKQETQILSMGWEDPLEKGMAMYLSILVWRIPWTEEPGGLQSMGLQRVRHYSVTHFTSLS